MAILLRSKSQIYGLVTDLQNINLAIAAEETRATGVENDLRADLDQEILDRIAGDDNLNNITLKKAANLSDLADKAAARTNLGVDSSAEVDAKILTAQLALGTNYNADDIAARDLLEDLTVGDVVFVADDGDGKWAQYKVGAVDVDGKGTAWLKVMDEDTFLNANTAAAIKAAYESNDDTNAFTDVEKAKLSAIDESQLVYKDMLVIDLAQPVTDEDVASAQAIKTYVAQQSASGGAAFKTESLVVANDRVVLAFAPKDGVIFNFATVRHVDANGVAWDIPVVKDPADATGKTFILAPDTTGEFDTKSVMVQYGYTVAV